MMNVVRELSCQGSQERTTIGDKKKCKMSRNNFSRCGIVLGTLVMVLAPLGEVR